MAKQMQFKSASFDSAEDTLARMVSPLLLWYARHARVLPWRENPSPYRVWLSEVMLQQTRVEAVKPYFERFLEELPSLFALAAAPEPQLMKLWEGLGYYNRARNLQKAAKIVVERYNGELPSSYEALLELPGFGAYTAGAVGSISFGLPVPAVDGNVLRVVSRLLNSREEINRAEVKTAITQALQAVLPQEQSGNFNQALMELGATVCIPNGAPKCVECPIRSCCKAEQAGTASELPVKAAKKARRIEEHTVFLILYKNQVVIQKRQESGLLAGLWEYPNVEGKLSLKEATSYLEEWISDVSQIQSLKPAKHIFSHVEWRMVGYIAHANQLPSEVAFILATREELLTRYTIPSAYRMFTAELLDLLSIADFNE